jgi:hypothetical protein
MISGEGLIQTKSLIFSAILFGREDRRNREGKHFINFSPAISDKAVKAIGAEIRGWDLPERSDKQIEDLSRMFNPVIRGWLQYYGRYYRSALYPPMRHSIAHWPAGLIESTKSCVVIFGGQHTGSHAFRDVIRSCLLIGRWVRGVAPWREPYELRGSRTVVCPAKAGMFSGDKSHRGKSQSPVAWNSREEGNQISEAY